MLSFCFSESRPIYQTKNNSGYMQVKLYNENKVSHKYVHRLVALVFVPGYLDGLEVNHKDSDRSNNVCTNLEWVTRSQNHKHRCALNCVDNRPRCCKCGKKITYGATMCFVCSKLSKRNQWPTAEQLELDLLSLSFLEIGRKYNCSDNNVRKICKIYGLPSDVDGVNLLRNGSVAQR